jgi:SOS response regulatory protein OraA/RecX
VKKQGSASRKKSQARRKAAKRVRRQKRKGQVQTENEAARRTLQGRGFDMSKLRALASRSTEAVSLRSEKADREFSGADLLGTATGTGKVDKGE